ncbi:MAG TPA: 30S ribosomal protein S6 [Patescibacteria group bacterium]|nr:30S ribosomal protein S6 [Patescibacteria group bacterium]
MQNYELLLILPGTLAESEVAPVIENVKQIITENGGQEISVETDEKRRLAYPIKNIRYGYFNLVFFQAETEVVEVIKKKLLIVPNVLRVLVSKYDPQVNKSRKINFGLLAGEEGIRPREEKTTSESEVATSPVIAEGLGGAEKVEMKEQGEEKKIEEKTEPKGEVDLQDIDKKLDEILEIDLTNV